MSRLWWLTSVFCFRLVTCFTISQQCRQSANSRLQIRHTWRNIRATFIQSAATEPVVSTQLKEHLKGTCIYLVGMMGCGKSTVGEYLAKRLQYRSLDTDELAEYMIEMPIAQYFSDGHEAEFREVEYQVLMQLSQYTRVVVATGGGIVMKKENWGLLRHGLVVYLDLSTDDIYERLKANPTEVTKRPLLQLPDPLAKLRELSAQRKEQYESADVTVRVDPQHSPEQTADRVIEALMDFIKQNPPRWQTRKTQREQTAAEVVNMAKEKAASGRQQAEASKGFKKSTANGSAVKSSDRRGSITYVPMSDILSGKVQLPNATKDAGS